MKQLTFFEELQPEVREHTGLAHHTWHLFVDGASRNNPGPAGAGIYGTCDGIEVVAEGFFLGRMTNNEAEYTALILGLELLLPRIGSEDRIIIFSDSKLLVEQLTGNYRIKKPELQVLAGRVKSRLNRLPGAAYEIRHVLREKNVHADALANKGIDTQRQVPDALHKALHT